MTDQINKAKIFYNNFGNRLIKDYVGGNRRMEHAIQFALDWIPADSERVLDIGCGIGWSSNEILRHFPEIKVTAVDLSEELTQIATNLFGREGLEFSSIDVSSEEFGKEIKFDAVILLDVYEHIPQKSRKFFHDSLSQLLNPNARVILSCPSVFHQEFLRTHKPEGLQPVDEDVDARVLSGMAIDLSADLRFFAYQNIWKKNDYLHAVVERYSQSEKLLSPFNSNPQSVQLESRKRREQRVRKFFPDFSLPNSFRAKLRRFFP